jgi:putative ABC transport system permease protein
VLGFCLLAAVFTGVVFGLAPALQVQANGVHDALKDTARGSTAGKGRNWIRGALVVSEIAFARALGGCATQKWNQAARRASQ